MAVKDLEIAALIDIYSPFLTEKQRQYLQEYYEQDLSLSEIADNFGVTRQAVGDDIRRATAAIKQAEEASGIGKRFADIASLAREIRDTCPGRAAQLASRVLELTFGE
ncbi:MAG: hypothetical protein K6G71_08375 [Clostridiales bacterium]|nr:hypothetical protein [Clostridiales bacterium]